MAIPAPSGGASRLPGRRSPRFRSGPTSTGAARGGEVLLRHGFFGGIVLGFRCLVAGYCSPAGNKPLAFSGRLREAAPAASPRPVAS
jgi:hypothetical protein